MKKILLLICFLLIAGTAQADDYEDVSFDVPSGYRTIVNNGILHITDGNVVISFSSYQNNETIEKIHADEMKNASEGILRTSQTGYKWSVTVSQVNPACFYSQKIVVGGKVYSFDGTSDAKKEFVLSASKAMRYIADTFRIKQSTEIDTPQLSGLGSDMAILEYQGTTQILKLGQEWNGYKLIKIDQVNKCVELEYNGSVVKVYGR